MEHNICFVIKFKQFIYTIFIINAAAAAFFIFCGNIFISFVGTLFVSWSDGNIKEKTPKFSVELNCNES